MHLWSSRLWTVHTRHCSSTGLRALSPSDLGLLLLGSSLNPPSNWKKNQLGPLWRHFELNVLKHLASDVNRFSLWPVYLLLIRPPVVSRRLELVGTMCVCRSKVTLSTSGWYISGPFRETNFHLYSWRTCKLHSKQLEKSNNLPAWPWAETMNRHCNPNNTRDLPNWHSRHLFHRCTWGDQGKKLKEPIMKMLILAQSRNHPSK